jgi:RND superfamily putative drug exporter
VAALARFVTGRRTKFVVIAAWIVVAFGLSPLAAKLSDVTTDDFASVLPADAESTRVQKLLEQRFPGGDTATGLIVYRRSGGLTDADKAKITRDAQQVARAVPVVAPPLVPGQSPQLTSPDGDAAYTVFVVPQDFEKAAEWGTDAREIVQRGAPPGLEVYLTGQVGFGADFQEIFGDIDRKVMVVTIVLVLVLLGLIYRSPLIAIIPIFIVGLALQVANALIYLYAELAGDVNSNSTTILVVLMFGVGTDYCLLLVSRAREELHRTEDKHVAIERALRRSGPALLASGATVIAAMLVLLLSSAGSTKGLGPVSALGVACVLLAGVTLLPALLAMSARKGFWPVADTVAYRPDQALAAPRGIWRRVGDRVLRRPGVALAATVGMFAFFSLGLLAYKEDYSIAGSFKTEVESLTGFEVMEDEFAAGTLSPTIAVVPADRAADVRERLQGVEGVAFVGEPIPSNDRRLARVDIVFRDDPFGEAALERVDTLRERLRGTGALLGAGSAVQEDFNRAAERDLRVIVPAALFVITIILIILLQALVAPLVLIASVMLSFFGTLGLSMFFFIEVLGDPGVDASLPIYAFIFLVALGVDYTIFLMSRVREEARVHGTREGMLRALAATGPVITSAGIILAGTFSVLLTLPITFVFNIGFMVAVGILLDTFIVRTVMVPAAVELIGDRVWWPSTAQGGGHALREHVDEPAITAPRDEGAGDHGPGQAVPDGDGGAEGRLARDPGG